MHLAHAKIAVQRHHLRLLEQRHGAFEVKADCELARCGGCANVLRRVGHHIAFRLCGDRRAKAGDHRHYLRHRVHVHADVDRHIVHAGGVKTRYRRKVSLRVQRQARCMHQRRTIPVEESELGDSSQSA